MVRRVGMGETMVEVGVGLLGMGMGFQSRCGCGMGDVLILVMLKTTSHNERLEYDVRISNQLKNGIDVLGK